MSQYEANKCIHRKVNCPDYSINMKFRELNCYKNNDCQKGKIPCSWYKNIIIFHELTNHMTDTKYTT